MVRIRHRLRPIERAIINTFYALAALGFAAIFILEIAASIGRGELVSWTFLTGLSWLGLEWADDPQSLTYLHAFLSGTPLGLGVLVLLSGPTLLVEELLAARRRPRQSIDGWKE